MELTDLEPEALAAIAKAGCTLHRDALWIISVPIAERVALRVCANVQGYDAEDMASEILCQFRRILVAYDPSRSKWASYCSWKFNFFALDLLRRHDPLGVGVRRKRHEWYHAGHSLSDEAIHEGIQRIDRGYRNNIDD